MDAVQIALLIIIVITAAAIYFFFGSFLVGAGYQPTPRRIVRAMLEAAQVRPNDLLYDLGAGTGALVFPAAERYGARVVAVEVEPFRLLVLHLRRAFSPARDRIVIRRTNLFAVDLTDAQVVVVFLWPGAMDRIRPRFEGQLPDGARVVSYWHAVPEWNPTQFNRDTQVYLYRIPEAVPAASRPSTPRPRSDGT